MSVVIRPPLATAEVLDRIDVTPETLVSAGASPLDFLSAVYRDPAQPMERRLRAAIAAAPYAHPKFAVIAAAVRDGGFADRLDAAIKRSRKVIEQESAPGLPPPDGETN